MYFLILKINKLFLRKEKELLLLLINNRMIKKVRRNKVNIKFLIIQLNFFIIKIQIENPLQVGKIMSQHLHQEININHPNKENKKKFTILKYNKTIF